MKAAVVGFGAVNIHLAAAVSFHCRLDTLGRHKLVTNEKRLAVQPTASLLKHWRWRGIRTCDPLVFGQLVNPCWPSDLVKLSPLFFNSGEPSRTRTCDPLVKRAAKPIPSSHGSYDSLIFFTGCSRFGVHLITTIHACLPVFTSQICHNALR
jgi:hypothetical protein